MPEKNKAVEKLAQRVLQGYEAIHEKDYSKAIQLLEPLKPFMHQEDRPNFTFIAYLTIAQIGNKNIDQFLSTYEELQGLTPKNNNEIKLKERVDELFLELMEVMSEKE